MKNTIKILNDNNIKYSIKDDKIYLEDRYLDLSNKKLVGILDVSMIENLKNLNCIVNNLTKIICNNKLVKLSCHENKITKIVCNEDLNELCCSNNQITEINCNEKLRYISCYNNPILKLNRNNNSYINSDIYIYNNEYYKNHDNFKSIENKYFIRRFKNIKDFLYVYHNYMITYSTFYTLLNGKYN